MATEVQDSLFAEDASKSDRSGSFVDNMKLPVHRWFRYSAGFSAQWVDSVIRETHGKHLRAAVFDPFAGSGTTLISAQQADLDSYGVEAHPFVFRVAKAKLAYTASTGDFLDRMRRVVIASRHLDADINTFPELLRRCFSDTALRSLGELRLAVAQQADGSPESELVWLALVGILRSVSHVGTAPWQYVLPNKNKRTTVDPLDAFTAMGQMMARDMDTMHPVTKRATLVQSDARTCAGVPDASASLVITSPPYANNYDYADATRLEMTFLGEVGGWADLQVAVRQYLVRSCSQHVTERSVNLDEVLESDALRPIHDEIRDVCRTLGEVRLKKGGKKNYHLMAACYFADMGLVWRALRRVCTQDAKVCFVIGDSAPYGVYLPVVEWMGKLATAAGFNDWSFEKLRDRNTKWKNRKHRVPLVEGRLWVDG